MLDDATTHPYFIRAVYQWCIDTRQTPYILAKWRLDENPRVPSNLVNDGKIVLDISPEAVRHFVVAENGVCFTARFLGKTVDINIPLTDIIAIYSQEQGKGISFPVKTDRQQTVEKPLKTAKKNARPNLRVI